MTEAVLFYLFSLVAVMAGLGVVLARSPITSALSLVTCFFFLAADYVLLDAHFVAVIQLLVYAGAIMVLFIFVIMLLNLGDASSDIRGPGAKAIALALAVGTGAYLLRLAGYDPARLAFELTGTTDLSPSAVFATAELARQAAETQGVVGAVAGPLFSTYLVPFEVTSLLLLAAIIGAVVLAKRKI